MEWNDDSTGTSSRGMAGVLARIVRLPVAAFVFSMEMFVLTLRGLQRFTDDGVDAIAGGATPPAPDRDATPQHTPATPNRQKELAMPDTNLNDDMLKLVRYKVLFVKREYEAAFPEQEELVHDNMTDTAFVAWKIAEFIQHLDDTNMPAKWVMKNYPANQAEKPSDPAILRKWKEEKDKGGERRVHWLPEGDKKYLRVYYEVLARYAREKFKHDEREVEVLEQIRDVIQGFGDKGVAAGGGAGGKG